MKEAKKAPKRSEDREESTDVESKVDEVQLMRYLYEQKKNSKKKWRDEKDNQKEYYGPIN